MRRALPALLLLVACRSGSGDELGVDVFSNDTTPALFVVSLTGTLSVGMRGAKVYMRQDRSLVVETPGSLVIQGGEGTALISAFDTTRRIAVTPIGSPPESSATAVVGRAVRMRRNGEERRIGLELARP